MPFGPPVGVPYPWPRPASTSTTCRRRKLERQWRDSKGRRPDGLAIGGSSRQLFVVHRVENRGVPHLVRRLLAPGHVAGRLVGIPRVLCRVVPRGHELDPAAGG